MQEIFDLVFGYLRGIWRYRWVALVVAWGICIGGWPIVFQMPDQYKASARVYVDTSSMLRPLLKGLTVNTDVNRQIGLMVRTLMSRPNLEKIVRMTDLDLNAQTPEDLDRIVDNVKSKVRFGRAGRNFYNISFIGEDPQLAKRIVQSMLTLFVESTLGASRLDTEAAQRFIDEQIKEYAARLDAADQRLRNFKRKNLGKMPGGEGGLYKRRQAAIGDIKKTQAQLAELERKREELASALDKEEPYIDNPNSAGLAGPPTPFDARIRELQIELEGLQMRYTNRHPDVIWTRRTLVGMFKRRDEHLLTMSAEEGGMASNNPVYQQIKLSLSDVDAQMAILKAREDNLKRTVAMSDKRIDEVLQVEIDAKKLNANYSINKSRYKSLLQKRDLARMSQDVDERADDVKFKVIEPPSVPTRPFGPNRPRALTVVLIAGLIAGLALAFAISFLRSVFDNQRVLTSATGLPVLGSVSMVWTSAQVLKYRLEKVAFFLLLLALTGAYGVVMAVQLFNKTWL
jgi:polysaccharide chain length determinant protein (PEP-CTERM system associated)